MTWNNATSSAQLDHHGFAEYEMQTPRHHDARRRNGFIRRIPMLVAAAATLLSCASPIGSSTSTVPAEWELPRDTPDYLGRVEELELSGPVDQTDWLADTLLRLSLRQTGVRDVRKLPARLTHLDLSYTLLTELPSLPSTLLSLDLRWTPVRRFDELPSGLLSLALGGTDVSELPTLPSGLLHLTLEDTKIAEVGGLPAGLRSLTLVGASIEKVRDLPPSLTELTLRNTNVSQLPSLPVGLTTVHLERNPWLTRLEPPPLLVVLELDGIQSSQVGPLPAGLRTLHLVRSGVQLTDLPAELTELLLNGTVPDYDEGAFPTRLSNLTIIRSRVPPVESLPPSLRSLALRGVSRFSWSQLPGGLERADLRFTHIEDEDLSALPDSLRHTLRELDISATGLESLAGLPPGVETLTARWSKLSDLGDLSAYALRSLDLSESLSLASLGQLPEGLEILRIADTAVPDLDAVPAAVRVLDVSGTPIRSLRGFERLNRLEELTVARGQLETLEGLPPTVRILRFVDPIGY